MLHLVGILFLHSIVNLSVVLSSWQPDTLCCRECFTNKPLVQFINEHDLGTVLNLEYYNTDTPTKFSFRGAKVQRILLWCYEFVSGTTYTLWVIFHVVRVVQSLII